MRLLGVMGGAEGAKFRSKRGPLEEWKVPHLLFMIIYDMSSSSSKTSRKSIIPAVISTSPPPKKNEH